MRITRQLAALITLTLVATAALVASCSDNTTSPVGGGGAKELDSGTLPTGASYQHTFPNPGTFNYSCTIHGPGMAGQVIVVGGSPDSALVTITDNVYTPNLATVKPGGHVRWINNGSPHTVTSP
jgi:plastocyanin